MERRGPGPCALQYSMVVLPIPQTPHEPGLERGLQPGVRVWGAAQATFSPQKARSSCSQFALLFALNFP